MSSKKSQKQFTKRSNFDEPAQQPRYPVAIPEIINMDVLSVMLDDEVYDLSYSLESDRMQVLKAGMDTRPWDVELAYVKRELQLRRTRKEAHEKFLRLEDAQRLRAMYEEDSLPDANFECNIIQTGKCRVSSRKSNNYTTN
jgi:hypothetical protein